MATSGRRYVAGTREMRGRIDDAMRGGASVAQVDAQIIRHHGLDDENEAAMWLYAHSWEHGRYGYVARQAATARAAGRDKQVVWTE